MVVVIKLVRVVIYYEELPPTNSHDLGNVKNLYLHFHKTYGH